MGIVSGAGADCCGNDAGAGADSAATTRGAGFIFDAPQPQKKHKAINAMPYGTHTFVLTISSPPVVGLRKDV